MTRVTRQQGQGDSDSRDCTNAGDVDTEAPEAAGATGGATNTAKAAIRDITT